MVRFKPLISDAKKSPIWVCIGSTGDQMGNREFFLDLNEVRLVMRREGKGRQVWGMGG